MILEGYVTDKSKSPITNAIIEVKGENFATLYRTESDRSGYYKLDIPAGRYPFLTAVKDYGTNYLEYWCQNILLPCSGSLNVRIDKLEVYGLHVFSVKGNGNSLMVYFRPMSLRKFQHGMQDIAPDDIVIKAMIDNMEVPVIRTNLVKEFAGGREMSAYLIQVETGESNMPWHKFDLQITDTDDFDVLKLVGNIFQIDAGNGADTDNTDSCHDKFSLYQYIFAELR